MPFDIDGARAAGYSDAEITSYLAADKGVNFDVHGALQAGYSPSEVLDELSKRPALAAGKRNLQDAASSPAANHFTSAMPRDQYQQQFLATNPQASQAALDAVMAQYDQRVYDTATAPQVDAPDSPGPHMLTDRATFDQRLNDRLNQGQAGGIVSELPALQTHAPAPVYKKPSTVNTVAGNVIGGAMGTLAGAGAAGARLVGAADTAEELDQARSAIAARQKELGGDTFAGKVSNLVGSIVPALAVPEGAVEQAVGNAGLFAVPAFQDTLRAKLAEGYSRPLALAHAAEAFGINMFMPTVATKGAGAIVGKLGQADAAGLRVAAVALGSAGAEGAGFSAANSVLDKGTDALAGQQNDRAWLDPEDMAVQAAGFGLLRGAHVAAGAAMPGIEARAQEELQQHIADIGRAGTVDEAIAAATAAASAPPATSPDAVASMLQAIRPLERRAPPAPADVAAALPDGRIEPTLGEVPAPAAAPEIVAATALPAPAATELANPVKLPIPVEPTAADAGAVRVLDAAAGTVPLGAGWHAFPPESGTLGIPRTDMPQIQAEHRGAMTNFLNARGIAHEQVELPASDLKPTQAEFSPEKVQAARDYQGGDRSILVSNDGHVLDGHHQWLAAAERGQPVKAIRLDAPIHQLLDTVREFPSATTSDGARGDQVAPSEQLPEFRDAEVEDSNRRKIPGLSAEFDNGKGGQGVIELGIKDGRMFPTWVDGGLFKGSTGGKVRAMYERSIEEAGKRGLRFTSDDSVTADAARIYDSLARRGYDIEKNPRARLAEPPEVITARWLTDDGSPVFTVHTEADRARQATEARAALDAAAHRRADTLRAPAPEPAAEGIAPAKLSIGKLPNSAEPITVRDGVVHIGDYPAQDYETGSDITVPPDATPHQIKEALVAAGAIGRGNKIFGMPKADAAAARAPSAATADVPQAFLKRVNVDHQTYNQAERKWETTNAPADKALAATRADIESYEALLNCLKG